MQQILTLRLIEDSFTSKQGNYVYNYFIDFKKTFDNLKHVMIWAVLRAMGVDEKLIIVLKSIYENEKAAVKVGTNLEEWFIQEKGVRQGDPMSPNALKMYLERAM